jgi:putative membrane protein
MKRIEISKREKISIAIWLTLFFSVLLWSGINPADRFIWILEVFPAIIGLIILIISYNKFKFTPLIYWLILIHCIVLMIGGHYTYAGVPFFDSIGNFFEWERNNYDKIGHFMQGFVPALIARELLIRLKIINKKKWISPIVLSICLSIAAIYEFIEWFVALLVGESAEEFLGTQGYVWDTQSDMFLCLIGAFIALITLFRIHDKQIEKMNK